MAALGPMTSEQHAAFYANTTFGGIKFADMSRPAGLHVIYGAVLPVPCRPPIRCTTTPLTM